MFKQCNNISKILGGAICIDIFLKKAISFSLVLTLILFTLTFNPNSGPKTLAVDGNDIQVPTTGNWNDADQDDDTKYLYADFSWYDDPTKTEFTLRDEADLAGLMVLVNNLNKQVKDSSGITATGTNFAKKKIKLELADNKDSLDLGAHYWVPIGLGRNGGLCPTDVFKGSFDGAECIIKNMKIGQSKENPASYKYAGFFGCINGKDLPKGSEIKIENINIGDGSHVYTSGDSSGGIAGQADYSTIINCSNSGEVSANSDTGGIASHAYKSTIINCNNVGKVFSTKSLGKAGGIASFATGEIAYCSNSGKVSANSDTGGIVGYSNGAIKISNCSNGGEVYTDGTLGEAGGIVGCAYQIKISNCNNAGNITATGYQAGGIAGKVDGEIIDCSNAGEVSGKSRSGGIAGDTCESIISNCSNEGEIKTTGDRGKAGGIAGEADGEITNCSNSGDISASSYISYAGGIVGYTTYARISNTYYRYGCILNNGEVLYLQVGIGHGRSQKGTIALSESQMKAGPLSIK